MGRKVDNKTKKQWTKNNYAKQAKKATKNKREK